MTIIDSSEPGISFAKNLLDVPQRWTVEWRGLVHTGEVIVRETLHSQDFQPLTHDVSFRIIFTNKGLKPRDRPLDRRIALAVPRFRFNAVAETERVSRGLTLPPTANRRNPQMDQVFRSERASQQSILQTRIVEAYAQGRLYRRTRSPEQGHDFFSHETLEQCVSELAALMLSNAFPLPIYDHSRFPRTLTERDVAALFSGLVQGSRDMTDTIRGFGPGLGVIVEGSDDFNASNCRVHGIIE